MDVLVKKFNRKILNQTGLLSIKPKIFVCNVDEKSIEKGNKYTENFVNKFENKNTIIISADIEIIKKDSRKKSTRVQGQVFQELCYRYW